MKSVVRGTYQLLLHLDRPKRLRIGKLGTFSFPAGYYLYTGSAHNGLAQRLRRHLRKHKRCRWHIDYLLRHAQVRGISLFVSPLRLECRLNRETLQQPNAQVMVKGFGASDCRCLTHLVYLGNPQGSFREGNWRRSYQR